ncbi:hypothetical protein PENSTE_c012G08121 [Penicillium steckii]|uniref:Uncharacterized protein n=1 Tax=Penicillium steckii TaxID=303698 RepID=A0A1V6T613_9EURO|nr:hypothetical protein PENSTE_c012G08121 [Penicillium steckii]
MARTAQNGRPNPSPRQWRQKEYSDYQGNPVILGKVSRDQAFYAPEGKDKYTIQVYSQAPIQQRDFKSLYEYLSPSLDFCIFIEIYTSAQRDAFTCVEHQRHEVAHRKRLYENREESSESRPPLIPTFNPASRSSSGHVNNSEPNYDTGACLLLTSDSYRAGEDQEQRDRMGTGPLFINFSRKFLNQIHEIDLADRVDFNELDDLPAFAEFGTEVRPEATEIVVESHQNQYNMDQYVQSMLDSIQMQKTENVGMELDNGIDDPASVQDTWQSHQVRRILDEQRSEAQDSVSPDNLFVTQGPQDIGITVKNHSSEESDLQYGIFVQFLEDIPDLDLLEITGRLFTSQVLSLLDSKKTVRFDFRVPGASLSSILPISSNMTVGALHVLEDGSKRRVLPLEQHDIGKIFDLVCEDFAVVIDKPEFITEPGVLFLLNNIKRNYGSQLNRIIAQVRRSAGMPEVARRLAMLAVEENTGLTPHRKVTKEECMSLLGISLEQYQSAIFGPSR